MHDDECSIRCKLPAEAQNLLANHVMYNQEITTFAGLRIVLRGVKVKFSLQRSTGKAILSLRAEGLEIEGIVKGAANQVKPVEDDKEIQTLLKYKVR